MYVYYYILLAVVIIDYINGHKNISINGHINQKNIFGCKITISSYNT